MPSGESVEVRSEGVGGCFMGFHAPLQLFCTHAFMRTWMGGLECSGMEWNRMEWSAMECNV